MRHLLAAVLLCFASPAVADIGEITNPPALNAISGQAITPASVSATGGHSHIEDSNASLHIHDGTGAVLSYAASSVAVTNGVIQGIIGNTEILRVNSTGLGIGTTAPATTLDVNGSAQFGSGATKSTFTATGNLLIPGVVGIGATSPVTKLDIVQSVGYTDVGAATATHVHLWDNAGAASSFGSIGFGYSTVHLPGAFGWTTVDAAGYTSGDFFWRNRSVTTDTRPEEVMRLSSKGTVTASYQPAVRAYLTTTRTSPSGALTPIYFDSENYDTQSMHSVVTSSDTFTVPAGGGGLYLIVFSAQWASAATGTRVINQVLIDGVVSATTEIPKAAGTLATNTTTLVSLLTAGQAVTSKIYQDSGSVYGVVGDASPGSQVYLSMTKLW